MDLCRRMSRPKITTFLPIFKDAAIVLILPGKNNGKNFANQKNVCIFAIPNGRENAVGALELELKVSVSGCGAVG